MYFAWPPRKLSSYIRRLREQWINIYCFTGLPSLLNFLKSEFNLNLSSEEVVIQAFTHSSTRQKDNSIKDYERLEFLGDSCIEIIITDFLYSLGLSVKEMFILRKDIVSGVNLAYVSKDINLHKYAIVGKGCKFTDAIAEDMYESLVGAIYLELGFSEAKEFVRKTLWKAFLKNKLLVDRDYKTKLQELLQSKSTASITYSTEKQGELFISTVFWGKEVVGTGKGYKTKQAEHDAAKNAIDKLL